jgi:hypothetical protein
MLVGFLLAAALLVGYVQGVDTNSTLEQTIDHGDRLSCTPTNWYDVVVFFIGNYLAHAATVKSYPGEAPSGTIIATFGALLIPTSGLIRGLNAILRCAKFSRKRFWSAMIRDPDYDTAAASGSLCMVVRRKSWQPYPGDKLPGVILREQSKEVPCKTKWEARMKAFRTKMKVRQMFVVEPL